MHIFQMLFALLSVWIQYPKAGDDSKPHGIWVTEWSKDGQYIALGGDDSTIWIYDGSTYRLHSQFRSNSMIKGMKWHPRENLLALSTMKGVQLLDMSTGKLTTIDTIKAGGRGIGWNFSGELLALADGYGMVQLMDKKGNLLRSIPKHNRKTYLTLDWHPSKNMILTGSDEIILFDTSGKQLSFIEHREGTGVLSVQWHPSGNFFAAGDYGHESEGLPTLLEFYNEDGTKTKEIKGFHREEIRNLRWSNDGNYIATASDGLRIFSKEGKLVNTAPSKHNLWGIAWSKSDDRIITASYAPVEIKLWSAKAKLIREL